MAAPAACAKNRRRIAHRAVIDAADVHRLEHRRPRRELHPLTAIPCGAKCCFQRGLLPRDHQHAVLLIADADFLDASLRARLTRKCSDRRASERKLQEFTASHSNLQQPWRSARSRDIGMMVLLEISVECPAKIAMSALRRRAKAVDLLQDRVLPRRIFLAGCAFTPPPIINRATLFICAAAPIPMAADKRTTGPAIDGIIFAIARMNQKKAGACRPSGYRADCFQPMP